MTDLFICWKVREPQNPRRPKIDRTMIGVPTDFKHTAHIGAGDHFNFNEITPMSSLTATEATEGCSASSSPGTTPPSPSGHFNPSSSPLHLSNLRPIANPLISAPPQSLPARS